MRGSSAAGVDVALVRVDGAGLDMTAQLLLHHHRPYDPALKRNTFAMRGSGKTAFAELARLGREISLAYADCVNDALRAANLHPRDVAAIAAHGQTLYHAPPDTIQWLDPALDASRTGCPVVSDFRRADCAAGGQGAPLVPFADYVLFQHPQHARVLLNIGGIANLTYLPPRDSNAGLDGVIAFDTGPGNCVCDWLCRQHDPTGPGYDVDGRLAATGRANPAIQDAMENQPYFIAPPPKSTDSPAMIRMWKDAVAQVRGPTKTPRPADLKATAATVTGTTVFESIRRFLPRIPDEIFVSGGGARNPRIIRALEHALHQRNPHTKVMPMDTLGVAVDAKEALAFALLAAATLDNVPSNVPSCTGAKRRVVLGSITPRP
jgi:anhydro-N-acetylmuramic acid kinase